jgi:transglutaminase-like putative cysteine protease
MRSGVVASRPPADQNNHRERPYPNDSSLRSEQYRTDLNQQASPLQAAQRFSFSPIEGWLPLLLLSIALCCIIYSIMAVSPVKETYILFWSAAAGLLVGLVIAKLRRLPQFILHVAACLIGYWLSVWLTSAIALHISWGSLIASIGSAITDPTGANYTSIVFLFYLAFLSFFLGYFGAWLVYRAHLPWLVTLVYSAILVINLNYAKQDFSLLIAIFLAALVLLVARVQLSFQVLTWKQEGLYTDATWLRGITSRLMRVAMVITLAALLFSFLMPGINQPVQGVTFWNVLNNAWANINNGNWQGLGNFGQLAQPPVNFFSNQLTISGSVHLPSGEVLTYKTSDQSSPQSQYLLGFTYDNFNGHTWTSPASANSYDYVANAALPADMDTNFTSVSTTVTIIAPPESTFNYIFAPSEPASFSVPITTYGMPVVTAWSQQQRLTSGEQYQATSFISTASPVDLSQMPLPQDNPAIWRADSNYNALKAFYLQVPSDLSPTVLNTARAWTQGATNMYQALSMLEAHLSNSQQFTYSLDNPPIPKNVDAVDWLLQTRQGYCTYYATAMTIMARLLGIPTRVASGFARGTLNTKDNVWTVNGSDAHSWVQAYFPDDGWINFDPTPGYSLHGSTSIPPTSPSPVATTHPTKPVPTATIAHRNSAHETRTANGMTGQTASTQGTALEQGLLLSGSLLLLLCSIVILSFVLLRRWWYNLYAGSPRIAGTFWRLCHIAGLVGVPPNASQTPFEYSSQLCQHIPNESAPIKRLTELFVRERWAVPLGDQRMRAEHELSGLWPGLRKAIVKLVVARPKKRKR